MAMECMKNSVSPARIYFSRILVGVEQSMFSDFEQFRTTVMVLVEVF